MQDWTQRFYSHAAWLRCRDAFIAKRRAIDGGLCQRCETCHYPNCTFGRY